MVKRIVVIYALYLGCIWLLLTDTRMIAPRVWYRLMKDWQAAAHLFGVLGIDAELAYTRSMERARLTS